MRLRGSFKEKLQNGWCAAQSFLCVGLDPEWDRLPAVVKTHPDPIFEFCRLIVDATRDLALAFKPQIAHFSALKAEASLEKLFAHIKDVAPGAITILDAKRGDIGSTADFYVKEAFDRYDADAVTINPYLGDDGVLPFLADKSRGAFVLCRTSNPSGALFQGTKGEASPLFSRVAHHAHEHWNANENVGLVVGATFPEELALVRSLAPALPFLVPGVGAQGGDPSAVKRVGRDRDGLGLLTNASRSIIYASSGSDFCEKARNAAIALNLSTAT